ncbi:MAG: hypothetical protein AMXMBFR20_28650 [Planctomycetia bacterium]|nr:MAG: hypothetical protein B6D36_15720 [Planctomycetes bacterium UTPLA1]
MPRPQSPVTIVVVPYTVALTESSWPTWLVNFVHSLRSVFAWFAHHSVLGIPLDWPARFVLIVALYALCRLRLSPRGAAVVAVTVLLAKELFDIFAHLDLFRPRAPDWGDAADIASGLAGLCLARLIDRRLTRRSRAVVDAPDE